MLENIDITLLYRCKDFFDLKDYSLDGTFSYCDITDLKQLLNLTILIIEKTVLSKELNNKKALAKIAQYAENSLIRAAAVNFYAARTLFSQIFYLISELKQQNVYHIDEISIIPTSIKIDNNIFEKKYYDIAELYKNNNADNDMLMDKILKVFYKYFHTGQIVINDAEAVVYSFSLLSAVSSPRDKPIYDFVKNIAFLYSSFVIFDRLIQFRNSLDWYEKDKAVYLSKTQKIDITSWLVEPRKGNIEYLKKILNTTLNNNDYHRLLLLIKKHLNYLDSVKNINPNNITNEINNT